MVLLTKFVSNVVLNPRAEKMEQHGPLGCVDRAGRAGRDVFVFLCVFVHCGVLRIVAHFSVDHGCLTSRAPEQSESHTNKFRFSNNFQPIQVTHLE